MEARNLETKKEAEEIAARLDGQHFTIIRSASDSGALYGSVTTRDAAEAATMEGFSTDRKQIALRTPIKELGLHEVEVHLHPEVLAHIILNVARSNEEAELQAAGKTIRELAAEEEAAAEFEIAELFDDIGATFDDIEVVSAETIEEPSSSDGELKVTQSTKATIKAEETVSDFVHGLTNAQKAQISAASEFLHEELQRISKRETRINDLLRLN